MFSFEKRKWRELKVIMKIISNGEKIIQNIEIMIYHILFVIIMLIDDDVGLKKEI